jgi:hypothetical protein
MRQSCATALVTEEPDELIAHVRVYGGAGWVTTGSTRKPTAYSLRSFLASAFGGGSLRALGGLGCMREQLERLRESVIHEVVPVLPD